MSSKKESRGTEMAGLAPDIYNFYSRTAFYAIGAVRYLDKSWRRSEVRNYDAERTALLYSVGLDRECSKALMSKDARLLCPSTVDANTRYEIQAGARTVNGVLPFDGAERTALVSLLSQGIHQGAQEITASEPALVDRWQAWLWQDCIGDTQVDVGALGASAVLGEGCVRLKEAASAVLGWD